MTEPAPPRRWRHAVAQWELSPLVGLLVVAIAGAAIAAYFAFEREGARSGKLERQADVLRGQLDSTSTELASARAELSRARAEAATARQQAQRARTRAAATRTTSYRAGYKAAFCCWEGDWPPGSWFVVRVGAADDPELGPKITVRYRLNECETVYPRGNDVFTAGSGC